MVGVHPPQTCRSKGQHRFNIPLYTGSKQWLQQWIGVGFWLVVMFVDSFLDDVTYIGDAEVCVESVVCNISGYIRYGSEDF